MLHHDAASHQAGSCSLGLKPGTCALVWCPPGCTCANEWVIGQLVTLTNPLKTLLWRMTVTWNVCDVFAAAPKRALMRNSTEGYNTLYLSLMPVTRFTRTGGRGGLWRPWICCQPRRSVFEQKQDPLVAVALSQPPVKASLASFEMEIARGRLRKRCARVRRYKHRDLLLFWTSFHVPDRWSRLPVGGRQTCIDSPVALSHSVNHVTIKGRISR